ncbi:alpha/beta hydrolase [Roseomonas populi]|uniref:Alpha/beta hydrolase n=1 Tax=Roseomonas populi TaxID=3121582 RepID=A0ABT1X9C7_9PROT|nr:alpha/beta hydrolase [Roseomonas pecuniae]MCR0984702.1 alpha/beta hydrolase [Roseomonas pecuniae]
MSQHHALPRRGLAGAAALAALATGAPALAAGDAPRIQGEEHWAKKGEVNLYLWRRRAAGDGAAKKPVLFLVHGSSFSGRGGFDLQVPGHPGYSMMEHFAGLGFDVWTMDHENYGKSSRTESNSDIRSGVEDLKAGFAKVEEVTGQRALMVYGQSSGAIRAGRFTNEVPDRVERLVLDAFTYTGEGAPEIMRRRDAVASYRARNYRMMNRESFVGIFSRDNPSTFEAAVPQALADYELALTDRAPSGTYLDMAANMPMVNPKRIPCPVLMCRAETDGNATDAELLDFFGQLPNRDKQFAMMRGIAHVAVLGTNRHRIWHVMEEFLTLPGLRGA